MKPRQSVQLSDETHGRLKVRSAQLQRSVRDVVQAAVDAYLGTCPTCRRPWPTTTVAAWPTTPPAVPQEKTALDVVATTGGKVTVATALPAPPSPLCRRCGHPATKHWEKGCLAGCNCSEGRYRP